MKKVMKLIFLERICTVLTCGDEDATATAIGILYAYATKCDIFHLLNAETLELIKMIVESVFTGNITHKDLLFNSIQLLYYMTKWYKHKCKKEINKNSQNPSVVVVDTLTKLLISLTRTAISTLEVCNKTSSILLQTVDDAVKLHGRRTGVEIILRTVITLFQAITMITTNTTSSTNSLKKSLLMTIDLLVTTIQVLIPVKESLPDTIDVSECPSIYSMWPGFPLGCKLSFATLLYLVLVSPQSKGSIDGLNSRKDSGNRISTDIGIRFDSSSSDSSIDVLGLNAELFLHALTLTSPDIIQSILIALLDT